MSGAQELNFSSGVVCFFFFLDPLLLVIQNESHSASVSFMTVAQDPKKSLSAIKLTKKFNRKRETVLALQLLSLFSFPLSEQQQQMFMMFFSVSLHLTFFYRFKDTATLRIWLT